MITGATRLVAMIGSSIEKVESPGNFNRYFEEADLDCRMIAMDVHPSTVTSCATLYRGWKNLAGCVVTWPHKQAFAQEADVLSSRAELLGAVNVIRREADGCLIADMVDGLGFLAAARLRNFNPAGRRAVVIGAGAAGSAIAYALCDHGVSQIVVLDLVAERATHLTSLLRERFGTNAESSCNSLSEADLVVNATTMGMTGQPGLPLPMPMLEGISATAFVADVVTSAQLTPFLKLAARKGCTVQTGAEMAHSQLNYLGAAIGLMPWPEDYTPVQRDGTWASSAGRPAEAGG